MKQSYDDDRLGEEFGRLRSETEGSPRVPDFRAMLEKARTGAVAASRDNVEFRQGYGEQLPVPDAWADVVISNGVLNLMPDKRAALAEMARVLKPGGRLQIGDILVQTAVPESAKEDIALWTG